MRGATVHQLHALARQIAHDAMLPRQDRARRQDSQPQQVGQVLRIRLVAAVLETVVLLDRSSVCEMHVEASILQPVDQPIPVVGRLDHDAGQIVLPPSQKADDLRDVVRQAPLRHNAIGLIDDRDNAVVGMQINPAVHHLLLLVAKCDSMTHISSTASLVAKAG